MLSYTFKEEFEKSIRFIMSVILERSGESINREGLKETPHRIFKAYEFLFAGYQADIPSLFKTFDAEGYDQIILLKDIEIFSMCEHHMLPFFGKAHIAYIPDKKVVGISKLARISEAYSRRLQIQERLGDQITESIMEYLQPKGAACIIEAVHLCMRMRGVEKQHSSMITSSLKGVFRTSASAKSELMELIK